MAGFYFLVAVENGQLRFIKNFLIHEKLIVKERLSRELEIAAEIQESLLPTNLPQVGGTSRVRFEGDDLVIRDAAGGELQRVPAGDGVTIRINGPSDVDDLIVFNPSEPSRTDPLIVDGGLGGNDVLRLEPATVDDSLVGVEYSFQPEFVVSPTITLRNVSDLLEEQRLVDLELIQDNLNATDRGFSFPASDDFVIFDTGLSNSDTILRIDGGVANVVHFLQPSGTTSVTLGDGADIFRFDLSLDLLPALDGQEGDDALVLTSTDQHLDLTDDNLIKPLNIEIIDIVGASPNQLTVSGPDVLEVTDADNMLVVIHDEDDTVNYAQDGWTVGDPIFIDGSQRHVLSNGDARIETINTRPFQNPLEPTDVNFSGGTTSLDALQIINFLGRFDGVTSVDLPAPTSESELPERYYDVNGSGTATALDALNVINFVGRQLLSGGEEGETVAAAIPRQRIPVSLRQQGNTTYGNELDAPESRPQDLALGELGWNGSPRFQNNSVDPSDALALILAEDSQDDQRGLDLSAWDRALTGLSLQPQLR